MKLLIDMNLSPRWAVLLTASDHPSVHWSDIGPSDTPDDVILAYANDNGYIILTKDLDFGTMLATFRHGKLSVVQLRMDILKPEPLLPRILDLLSQAADELEEGAMLTIGEDKARLRRLPFA